MSYLNLSSSTLDALYEICKGIEFFHHPEDPDGLCWVLDFGYGFGAYICKHSLGKGGSECWNMALVEGSVSGSWRICYDIPHLLNVLFGDEVECRWYAPKLETIFMYEPWKLCRTTCKYSNAFDSQSGYDPTTPYNVIGYLEESDILPLAKEIATF